MLCFVMVQANTSRMLFCRLALLPLLSTAMDNKIQVLQRAEGGAVEKAKKVLPKSMDMPPEALRCKYRRHELLKHTHCMYIRVCWRWRAGVFFSLEKTSIVCVWF